MAHDAPAGVKILLVSNLYPPHYIGGYELRCAQVAEYLRLAGHETRVVTSFTNVPGAAAGSPAQEATGEGTTPVERWLRYHTLDPLPAQRRRTLAMAKNQLQEARRFNRLLADWRPDVVNWWNLEGLTKTILPLPAAHGIPDVHWVEDTWLIREYGASGEKESLHWFDFWRGSWTPRALRPAVAAGLAVWERRVRREGIATRPFPNRPRHVCFVSEFMRLEHQRAGLTWPSSSVIHGGVAAERFYLRRTPAEFTDGTLRLLYAGYVEPNRGLHTIIAALGLLPPTLRDQVQLSVAHTERPKEEWYLSDIKTSIERLGLASRVRFIGRIPHEAMPGVYGTQHVLVSATTRAEGLPMTMMEAMCAGCAVITTGSGGAQEIADVAGLPLFPKDDPAALSGLIARLATDRRWAFEVATRGQEAVLKHFSWARMAEALGRTLHGLAEESAARRGARGPGVPHEGAPHPAVR
jgi:glycosyltransferase involved in cell wall biosynthesis